MMRIAFAFAVLACAEEEPRRRWSRLPRWFRGDIAASPSIARRRAQLTPVTSEDIAMYFGRRDLRGLHDALVDHFTRTPRQPWRETHEQPLRAALVAKGAGDTYSSAYKLEHDIAQLEYIAIKSDNATLRGWISEHALPRYRRVLARIPPLEQLERTKGLWGFRPDDLADLGGLYNKAIHTPDPEPVSPMLNARAFADVDARFADAQNHPVVVIDDALTPAALAQIRQLLLESTVFFETKMPERFGGYVGAVVEDGLHARAFLALADAIRGALPGTIGDEHALAYLWCYKYDERFEGIRLHADEAAVNVNIWLTPDDANLDPDSGGLVVYTARPADDATLEDYNANLDDAAADRLLAQSDYANITVPYRANRIVLFDSALFHRTDRFRFKPGYENRRINLTLLFGKMKKAAAPATLTSEPGEL